MESYDKASARRKQREDVLASAALGKMLYETKRFIEENSQSHSQRNSLSQYLALGSSISLYIRLDYHTIEDINTPTLTIASIELAPWLRSKNVFMRYLATIRRADWQPWPQYRAVVIECVLNRALAKRLRYLGAIDICQDETAKLVSPVLALKINERNLS